MSGSTNVYSAGQVAQVKALMDAARADIRPTTVQMALNLLGLPSGPPEVAAMTEALQPKPEAETGARTLKPHEVGRRYLGMSEQPGLTAEGSAARALQGILAIVVGMAELDDSEYERFDRAYVERLENQVSRCEDLYLEWERKRDEAQGGTSPLGLAYTSAHDALHSALYDDTGAAADGGA